MTEFFGSNGSDNNGVERIPGNDEEQGWQWCQLQHSQPFEVDLVIAMNTLASINEKHRNDPIGPVPGYIEYLKKLSNCEKVSGREALGFLRMVQEKLGVLEKKTEGEPTSPTSTTSTASG